MAENLPLLVFPRATSLKPPKGVGFASGGPITPNHNIQELRLEKQFANLASEFSNYKASISKNADGLEPEAVLVIEIAGRLDDFKQAVEAAGLEWLGEWDIDGIEPDDNFYQVDKNGIRTEKKLGGRIFLSLASDKAFAKILSLWSIWKKEGVFPTGFTKWRDIFGHIIEIREWGIIETLKDTGMLDLWEDLLDPINPDEKVAFQIELFYRKNKTTRLKNEKIVRDLLELNSGSLISPFIDMAEINFHAVKAELPAKEIKELLKQLEADTKKIDIQLFNFSGVMYFRPTGQSLTIVPEESNATDINLIDEENDLLDSEPIVALLDGVPQLNHTRLKNRIRIDDPNNISEHYLVGQRLHGTSMASLIIHGELDSPASSPLKSPLYVAPILQPDQTSQVVVEHVPKNEFLEDRIEIAVRRIFEGQGTVEAQAPHVKIINLSIGDSSRPFINTLSPLARLIDYLSWKYRVIFVISAGNFTESIDLELREDDYKKLTNDGKIELTLKQIERNLFNRRILSPAESMNSITVGALHSDQTPTQQLVSNHTDILPSNMGLVSPISRLGYGFRKSVKPEIFFSGGKQLYNIPPSGTIYKINNINSMTGQKVAWDSITQGDLAKCAYTKGTSNATALATRGGAIIYDSLSDLQKSLNQKIPENLISVLIKTLLVHGARQGDEVKKTLINTYKTKSNSRKIKEVITRYTGYGSADIEKVVTCTEQRATVLGFGEIKQNQIHEYSFPIPQGLSQSSEWRRLVISLAWLTPINSNHRNLREAKLELSPAGTWDAIPLKLKRTDTDHNQVHRGTVQHEIFEGTKEISAFQDGENIKLRVICKADAITKLDEEIPYGLAVTLEVEEGVNINIYQQIRTSIRNQSQVKV